MSLLDDVSIVVTPNAYKAGTLYGVLPTATEGSELVTNGGFTADAVWIKSPSGVTIDGSGFAYFTSGQDTYVFQSIMTIGKQYSISLDYNITSISSGYFGSNFGSGNAILSMAGLSGSGTLSGIITATNAILIIRSSTFDGTITNVSVKEWTASDMDVTRATAATRVDENGLVNYAEVLGDELVTNGDFSNASDWDLTYGTSSTTWSISNGKANATNSVSYDRIAQVSTIPAGTYKITINISSYTSGTLIPIVAGQLGVEFPATVGVHTQYITGAGSTQLLAIASNPNFTGAIDNVSVKKVDLNNVPRIDYTGGGCPHILAEPQRTNLVTYSEDFSNSSWTKNNTTVTNNHISPDGTENAYLMTDNATDSQHGVYVLDLAPQDSNIYSRSVFVKKGTARYVVLSARHKPTSSGTSWIYDFDTNNWTTTGSSGVGQSIEVLTNGWIRLSISHISDSNFNNDFSVGISSTSLLSGASYSGSGDTLYIYGGQLEEGSYPTSYIPTSGSTVTRNQDQFTRDGIGSLINSTEGVLFLEMAALSDDGTSRQLSLSDGSSANNKISIIYTSTTNQIQAFIRASGSISFNVTFSLTDATTFSKIAIKWKLNDFALWVDGTEVATDTSGATPTGLNTLSFDDADGNSLFFSKVKQLQVYKTALSDEQLTALTS